MKIQKILQTRNKWIEQEYELGTYLRSTWHETKRYNFLGGESFANKRHNEFLKDLSVKRNTS